MSEERIRWRKLIEHWIEHNEEHRSRIEKASLEIEQLGFVEVSKILKEAARYTEEVSRSLKKALEKI
ncbi:MAG: hypothetical protein ACUVV4_01070 [Candidatus Bathyarchaeia archaeon]